MQKNKGMTYHDRLVSYTSGIMLELMAYIWGCVCLRIVKIMIVLLAKDFGILAV